jgi:hypothetical protein
MKRIIGIRVFIWLLLGCWNSLAFTTTNSRFGPMQISRPSRSLRAAQDPDLILGKEVVGFNQLKISFVTGNEMKVSLIFREAFFLGILACKFAWKRAIDSLADNCMWKRREK